ncbi:hypothetical protein ACIF85_36760 [Streptomyces sp. NPDC086033]|uniref:hypothetical protein n=1 Tax=Streptomyces sp. NPDC086033 TaxID=3365747 RepID=UPI0037CE2716
MGGLDAEPDGQVRPADPGRPERDHVLARIVLAEANDQATVPGPAGLVISRNLRLTA